MVSQLKALLDLSEISCSLNHFKEAMDFALQAEAVAEKHHHFDKLARSYQMIGLIYSDLTDFQKSSSYYFKSLKLYEKIDNPLGKARALSKIGSVFFDQKNYTKALEYYTQAMEIFTIIKNNEGIAGELNNIAAIYGNLKQYDKVIANIKKAVMINQQSNNKRSLAINLINLGIINQRLKHPKEAFSYYQKALTILNELNHTLLIAKCKNVISTYYYEEHKIDSSIITAREVLEIGLKNGLKSIAYDAYSMLHKAYLDKKDTTQANQYLISAFQVKDSLAIEKSSTQISKLELKYDIEKNNQLARIKEQKKYFLFLLIIITLVLGLGIIVLFFTRQRIKVKNTQLEKSNLEKELQLKNKELTLKVMGLLKKNEMLSQISKRLINLKDKAVKDETKSSIRRIYKDLQKSIDKELEEEFEVRFKQVHSEFYIQLMDQFPNLSPNEQRLCAFLRLNMSSKEISQLTGQSVNAIETARYRLRKKLNITNSSINLITFLSKI